MPAVLQMNGWKAMIFIPTLEEGCDQDKEGTENIHQQVAWKGRLEFWRGIGKVMSIFHEAREIERWHDSGI